MGLENVPRCQHVKMNGTQCGSPALRRRRLCFFHRQVMERQARIAADQFAQLPFDVPVLEDANSIQVALMQVMQMLAMRRIEHKTAGLLLYALQTATSNVRNTKFEPGKVTNVVIDRDTVHLTAIDGPQWFEEDFDEEEEDGEEEELETDDDQEEDEGEETEEEDEEDEAEQVVAGKTKALPAANVAQAAAGPGKRPAIRAGESPVDAMKRILAEAENRQQSG
jgi:hypothetical protein